MGLLRPQGLRLLTTLCPFETPTEGQTYAEAAKADKSNETGDGSPPEAGESNETTGKPKANPSQTKKSFNDSPAAQAAARQPERAATDYYAADTSESEMSEPHWGTTDYKPDKPILGDVARTGKNTWTAWVGGKPKPDWSGLEDGHPAFIAPTQYRHHSMSSEAKAQAYRVKGLEHKFTRDGDLARFQKEVSKHLIKHGMDTVAYTTNPAKKEEVIFVIDNHGLFSLKRGSSVANRIRGDHFDSYSWSSNTDAIDFF